MTRPASVRVVLGGAAVDLMDRETFLATVRAQLNGDRAAKPLAVASANLDHVHHFGAGRQPLAGEGLEWLVLLDGVPLVRRAGALTAHRWPLLAGSDMLPDVLAVGDETGATVGFLGGTEQTHRSLRPVLDNRLPGLKVGGWWSPTRHELTDRDSAAALADEIALSGIDLLVVGLGKPRQEQWIERHGVASGARVFLAFGAAADFLAGTATRAPAWVRRSGVEFAYRLAREPRRLGRRYCLQGPVALWHLWTDSRLIVPVNPCT